MAKHLFTSEFVNEYKEELDRLDFHMFNGFKIRYITMKDATKWYLINDVALALSCLNTTKLAQRTHERNIFEKKFGIYVKRFVNAAGFYEMLLKSRSLQLRILAYNNISLSIQSIIQYPVKQIMILRTKELLKNMSPEEKKELHSFLSIDPDIALAK